jgi:hypothetical protein
VQAFSQWPFYFAYDHPQDEAGDPLEWDQVRTADDDAAAAEQPQPDDPFRDWSPQQAAARIEAAVRDPKYQEWRDAYWKREHPDHDLAVREFERLHQIAYPEEPDEPAAAASQPDQVAAIVGAEARAESAAAPTDRAPALRRIDELYRHPVYAMPIPCIPSIARS